jgi:tRNA 5-methylaminomethyl-2-thiouridine biosynthesis bifunctional protein
MSAGIEWRDGEPWSPQYGDVFFARGSGLAESRHVFLDGNRLGERFAALRAGQLFTIGETGFGTALNFLATCALFAARAPANARLAYVSAERHPLSAEDLHRATRLWPELDEWAFALRARWQAFVPGFHRITLQDGRQVLTLLIGDATARYTELDASVDAWFLDGFAPDRNPAMWSPALLREVARCSRPGATLATFSVAGAVRRELEAAGFALVKRPGFGRKREMLTGELVGTGGQAEDVRPAARKVVVVGAGLAGAAAAASLAARGCEVTVLDRRPAVAAEASGNPQGILYARLSGHDTPLRRLLLLAYQHVLRELPERLARTPSPWSATGVLQLAFDAHEAKRQALLADAGMPASLLTPLDPAQASDLAGVAVASGVLHFPGGGWTRPAALVESLLAGPGIAVRLGEAVREIVHDDTHWRVRTERVGDEEWSANVVVLATAYGSRSLLPVPLPLRAIAGQVTLLPATVASGALRTVLCARGYVAPSQHGFHTLGATHRLMDASTDMRVEDHSKNLEALRLLSLDLTHAFASVDAQALSGRAAVRCTSPDTLPIVGSLDPRGLYVSLAHGSRGLVTTLLAGELLASAIAGEPPPLPRQLVQALSPARYGSAHELPRLWHHRSRRKAPELP